MEFLRAVAKIFASCCDGHTFVFPNRRSMKFFQKYLGMEYAALFGRPLLSPQMITISELFSRLSNLYPADSIGALYVLYKEYRVLIAIQTGKKEEEIESFDDFLSWGTIIISDFNDIDKYMIDARQLFNNIRELKELDSDYSFLNGEQLAAVKRFWGNFLEGGIEKSPAKESFSAFWSIMYDLYNNFREKLFSMNSGYEGMIYRKVAEEIESCDKELDNLVFIGFNAPNRCELALMRWCRNHGGDFYWDFYGEMVTDPFNKASIFTAPLLKEFPSAFEIACDGGKPEIEVIGAASGVGQTLVAADILKRFVKEESIKSAVVLPDETLLIPLLNSIPGEYEKINVTMGYPVTATPLPDLLSLLARLQLTLKEENGSVFFYHAAVTAITNHSYIRNNNEFNEAAELLRKRIREENLIYIDAGEPLLKSNALFSVLFTPCRYTGEIIEWQISLLRELDLHMERLHREFIYRIYLAVTRLRDLNIPLTPSAYFRLLRQVTSTLTVPFKGEPLEGLQILGSLETRCLDFDNLIILSANEGRFPSSADAASLIPYNLRYGFGLPTYELHDAIAAYHFYRSICRVKHLYMIYDTRSDGINKGEESRYIKQLKYHYNLNVTDRRLALPYCIADDENPPAVVEKSDEVMDKLRQIKLSASALNTYLYCPLQFYFSFVEHIKEEKELSEEIDSGTFGTIYHKAMEQLYKPYIGRQITREELSHMAGNSDELEKIICNAFEESKIHRITGENVIIKEVIKKYIRITLRTDSEYTPFTYMGAEKKLYASLLLKCGERADFIAFIDRIDRIAGELRLVDYKTGKVEKPKEGFVVDDLFNRDKNSYTALFQLYLYALIVKLQVREKFLKGDESLNVAIYPVTTVKENRIVVVEHKIDALNDFQIRLADLVEEIFDSSVPFRARAEKDTKCEYCPFNTLCNG